MAHDGLAKQGAQFRVFIRRRRSKNSSATTQNSVAKFCLFPDRTLPFHDDPPVTLQYSPVSPILNETPVSFASLQITFSYKPVICQARDKVSPDMQPIWSDVTFVFLK